MDVERIEQVEFKDVDEIDADLFADPDLNGVVLIVEGNSIDCIEIIFVVEVHIKTVLHHDHFAVNGRATAFWDPR